MSAIAGVWNFDGRPQAAAAVSRMLAAQEIYGPHARDHADLGAVALGRNLFRILPEDRHDFQPLTGAEGRFVLVADLRLDNRQELAAWLALDASRAAAMADCDLLLQAWERWGDKCLDRLVGDYAFALWDAKARHLVLARDPMSSRPLFYHRGTGFIAFASMPKGLHALPQIPRAPDEEFVVDHLALMPEAPGRSFFAGIARVDPGHLVTVTETGLSSRRHWSPRRQTLKLAGSGAYAEALLHHLDRATRDRLRGAEGAVGSHLSAGFDSSAVASSAALEMARRGGRVIAFTAVPRKGYDGPAPRNRCGDEGPLAARTAAMHPNIEHVLVHGTAVSPLASLERNFRLFERPVLNLCNQVWSDAICDAARQRGLSVLLNGQMGNMTLSYDGLPLLPALLGKGHLPALLRYSRGVVESGMLRWPGVALYALGPYLPAPLWRWINRHLRGNRLELGHYTALHPAHVRSEAVMARARAGALDVHYRPRRDGFEARLWALNRVDLGCYNKGILSGWGLDYRDPTADRRLFEFCLSVPEEEFLKEGGPRSLARRALVGRVSPQVLGMRGKGQQAVDWHEGLTAARDAVSTEVARLEDCGPAAQALDLARLKQLMEAWPVQGWESDAVVARYRLALLRGLSAGDFMRRASGSNS